MTFLLSLPFPTEKGAANLTAQVQEEESLLTLVLESWYIMIPLFIFAVIAVYIFFERYSAITRASKIDAGFMDDIKNNVSKGDLNSAKQICHNAETPVSRMILKGLSRLGAEERDIAVSIENAGKLEIYKLEKSLSLMATISGAAPMIGFLGTVLGMVNTFHVMKSQESFELSELSGGIMEALLTTVGGLIVGIIAYVAYNTLVARVQRVVHKMEESSIEFMDLLQEPSH